MNAVAIIGTIILAAWISLGAYIIWKYA